ncbi:MAG: F0F1 ATP synthase subunit delta [Sandaracinaceae bacterium]
MELSPTTLIFETINFLVLVFVLWRILYRPLRASIEARRAKVEADLSHAAEARERAEERQREWEARDDQLAALRDEARREALDLAERERGRILDRAREDASAELTRAQQLVESEREAAEQWVRRAVWERGTALAGRMLQRLAPDRVDAILGERLVEALESSLGALDEEDGLTVELAGAAPPSAELVSQVREVMRRALGHAPRLTTVEDPSLVGGYTVRAGHHVVDASIAGQLAAFRELARELDAEALRD